ncbi:MAG: hypothetical protein ACR2PA_27485 [Hyphomicrobiaceae bacterium]
MISKVFLGRAWHWALLVAASTLFWFCGSRRLHVIEFNLFIIAMLIGTGLVVFAVVWFHRPGEQVTRDVLVASEDDGENSAILDRA